MKKAKHARRYIQIPTVNFYAYLRFEAFYLLL